MMSSACLACGQRDLRPSLTPGPESRAVYGRCAACGSYTLLEAPADAAELYESDYYSVARDPETIVGAGPRRAVLSALTRACFAPVVGPAVRRGLLRIAPPSLHGLVLMYDGIARVRPNVRGARMLDVGCGAGNLVYSLSLGGCDVRGIDPFAPAERVFGTGARVEQGYAADASGPFDLVMFHHSLEHSADPLGELQAAVGLVGEHGTILVRIPTVSSEAFDRYGAAWAQLDAPRHLMLPTRAGLEALARRAGLHIDRCFDDSWSFQFWGSEAVRLGGDVHDAGGSVSRSSRRAGERAARKLNAAHRGDQVVMGLRPHPTA